MIYAEEILTEDNRGYAKIGRQKNSPDGKWYGLHLDYRDNFGNSQTADNDTWLIDEGLPLFKEKNYKKLKAEFEIESKDYLKRLRKLMLKAEALGWFDGYK